jgi:hypothetical protein
MAFIGYRASSTVAKFVCGLVKLGYEVVKLLAVLPSARNGRSRVFYLAGIWRAGVFSLRHSDEE